MSLSFDDKESFIEAAESLRFNNPPSDPDTSNNVPAQNSERNGDISFNNLPSDQNALQQMGGSGTVGSQERREDT